MKMKISKTILIGVSKDKSEVMQDLNKEAPVKQPWYETKLI